ncbi:MAG: mechanosensitive ion channel [Clostridia bacterium]|nr:mechanosensitive ion channel [Clostridia bacterium]
MNNIMKNFFEKIFNENAINSFLGFVSSTGVKLLVSLLIFLVGFKLVNVLIRKVRKGKLFSKVDNSVKSFLTSFFSIALKAIILITIAAYLGVPMSSMVALVASAGVAIGLALQGGLSNIASGIMIIIFRPFAYGDFIDCAGQMGSVDSIGIFHTTLATVDNKKVVIPNSVLTSQTLVNYSAEKTRRVDLEYTAAYDCDIDKVEAIILDTAKAIPEALKREDITPIEVMVVSHDASAIRYRIRIWCNAEDYWTITFAMNENVKKAFDREGIEIPYNKMDVNIVNK